MGTDTLTLLAALGTLIASACGGAVDVELGRVGQGTGGSALVPDGGTGGFTPVPDSGAGGAPSTARVGDAAPGSGGTSGAAGTAGEASGGSAGEGTGGAAGSAPSLCDGILIHNAHPGAPAYYPSIYAPPAEALPDAQKQAASFLAHYGLTADQIDLKLDEMTATASFSMHFVGDPTVPLLQPPGKIENGTFESAADAFLLQWDGLFHSTGLAWVDDSDNDYCSWGLGKCRLGLSQDYCGFEVTSDGGYTGRLILQADQDTSLIGLVSDELVPVIPIYSEPMYSRAQVAASLVGRQVELCGEASCQMFPVTEETTMEFSSALQVVVRRPEGENHLEYRLAYKVLVMDRAYLYVVDAIVGTILYERALMMG